MDLFRSMHAFVTTVRMGSMSAAADELNMTSAMVGQHIAALESRLGTRLLNRTTRRQSLTGFGESYLEQCKDILQRVALADREAEVEVGEVQGHLRVTAPVSFGVAKLMPALVGFRQIAPKVTLDLVLTDNTIDMVEEGIDVAFRIGDVPDSRMVQRILMPYRMVVCASPDYLSRQGVPAHPRDLMDHQLMGFAASSARSLLFKQANTQYSVNPNYAMTVNSGQALANAAKAGLGIAIQPEILLAEDIERGDLVRLLPDWTLGERKVSVLYYRHKHMAPKIRSFIQFALTELSDHAHPIL